MPFLTEVECCVCKEHKQFHACTPCSKPLNPVGHEPLCCSSCMERIGFTCVLCRAHNNYYLVYSSSDLQNKDVVDDMQLFHTISDVGEDMIDLTCTEDINDFLFDVPATESRVTRASPRRFSNLVIATMWQRVGEGAPPVDCNLVLEDFFFNPASSGSNTWRVSELSPAHWFT